MRKVLIFMAVSGAAIVAGSPAVAQPRAAPPAAAYHRSPLEIALSARLDSIRARIELLRQEGRLGSEEARDLRQQSRLLEERLIGLTERDAADVELAIGRLQARERTASADALRGESAFAREEDRYEEQQSYEMRHPSEFDHLDRHIAPPVDRWEDPFDRGDEL